MKDMLKSGAAALGLTLSDEMCRQFDLYRSYLLEQNRVMNLTAITDEREVIQKHFLDSLAVSRAAELRDRRVIDVGTGAGLPGLPLKIALPTMELTLLDSLNKRVDFLRSAAELAGLEGVSCVHARAEEHGRLPGEREGYDIALSRAVARLNLLAELCLPFVRPGGRFLAMKGPDCDGEVAEAKAAIRTLGGELRPPVEYHIPGTDIAHRIVVIQKVHETPGQYPRRFAKIQKQPL